MPNSLWKPKLKKSKLESLSTFYAVYHNEFQGSYMKELNKLIINKQVKLFLKKQKKLTIFESKLFEKQLQNLGVSSEILKINTNPIVFILNSDKKTSVGISQEKTKLSLFDDPLNIKFSNWIDNEDYQYIINIIPAESKIKVLNTNVSNVLSKYESGTQLVDNPDYILKLEAKKNAKINVNTKKKQLESIKLDIYQLNQSNDSMTSAAVTGQLEDNDIKKVAIPTKLLNAEINANKELSNAQQALQLSNISLIKTDKKILIPNYKNYKVKEKNITVQKTLKTIVFLKKAFQTGYYKYKSNFTEQQDFKIFENVNLKDEDMMKNKISAKEEYNNYKNTDIIINTGLEELKNRMKFIKEVKSIN